MINIKNIGSKSSRRASGGRMRILLGLCLIFITSNAYALDMTAIATIESSNNPKAISYKGASSGRGLYQISEILLKHYNQVHKTNIKSEELFTADVNERVAIWYIGWLEKRPYVESDEDILIAYNWGYGNLIKFKKGKRSLPKETKDYIIKYRRLTNV